MFLLDILILSLLCHENGVLTAFPSVKVFRVLPAVNFIFVYHYEFNEPRQVTWGSTNLRYMATHKGPLVKAINLTLSDLSSENNM